MTDLRSAFGKRVRELRVINGMTQETLAYRAGLDRTYLSGVERGERNVSLLNIEKIATALQVSVEYIFSGERFSVTPSYQSVDLLHHTINDSIDEGRNALTFYEGSSFDQN
ncbi:hypothetical protein J41TS12_05900 [Paenibacillus antibioticophila]|uniref:HTH cro/C1-type domain-containing protein n=1 Tax=Paenibacillus antibioticophila TaxID=1274374 RepID=A0A919XPU5_9BACL|nr:helix-turn-helix transcriptional regulator [Paenibacillus antibioticophila]GIO35729.1 hypothetical protein J41TS12_05900 [Paenibacillus antibioticophila]